MKGLTKCNFQGLSWAGQVAYDVDRTIAHYVLDTVVGQGHYINKIEQMQSAIDGDRNYADVFETPDQLAGKH